MYVFFITLTYINTYVMFRNLGNKNSHKVDLFD